MGAKARCGGLSARMISVTGIAARIGRSSASRQVHTPGLRAPRSGGMAQAGNDAVMGQTLGKRMRGGPLLFGRRTYEDFAAFWPSQPEPNPFTAVLNNIQKYVVSRTLEEPLAWGNSTLLKGDAAQAVTRLKEQSEQDIAIMGSGVLVQLLMRRRLIDEYLLMIHPLILGVGRRLFPDGTSFAALRLVNSVPTTTGVIIATYQPVEATDRP